MTATAFGAGDHRLTALHLGVADDAGHGHLRDPIGARMPTGGRRPRSLDQPWSPPGYSPSWMRRTCWPPASRRPGSVSIWSAGWYATPIVGRLDDNSDLDFTTDARPDDIERLVTGWADAVWDQGRRFGTIGLCRAARRVEITTHRAEAYSPDSRKPDVVSSPMPSKRTSRGATSRSTAWPCRCRT